MKVNNFQGGFKHMKKRMMSMLLAFCMVFTLMPQTALAAGSNPAVGLSGIADSGNLTACENHPEHTGQCGYAEGVPCGHVCDESCGGAPEEPENGTGTPEEPENGRLITAFATPSQAATVAPGTSLDDLPLPATVEAELEDADSLTQIPVDWMDDDSYDSDTPGDYSFTGQVDTAYSLAVGVSAPEITVVIRGDVVALASTSVNITGKSVAEAQAEIQAAINAAGSSDTVTATGSITDVTDTLSLSIPAGVTVKWQADITASDTFSMPLILLDGNGSFDVDGGTVSATTGMAIRSTGASSTVTVSGSGKVQSTAASDSAIFTSGSVEVQDTAEVSATTGTAISTGGEVTVTGGEVSATTVWAISAGGAVTVTGGAVSATTGITIFAFSESSTVTVSGGAVSATTGTAIFASSESSTVTVSKTGKVQATGDNGYAISTKGNVDVKDSAEVSATTGMAIYAGGAVTVSGGLVFAYGSAVIGTGNVIQGNSISVTEDGIVITWYHRGSGSYDIRSDTDISRAPSGSTASAYWYTSGGDSGIAYKNGSTKGFIPLNVTVNKLILTENDLTCSIPIDDVYDGSAQGIGAVSGPTGFDETTGGTITVLYNGENTVPTNAGSYTVTATIFGGTEYSAVGPLSLGTYTIGQKELTGLNAVTSVENKEYDGSATAAAAVTPTAAQGLLGSDSAGVEVIASFDNKHVGEGKSVTITGWSLTGTDAGNYSLPSVYPSNLTANITAKPITITGVSAQNRAYNGTDTVQITGGALQGAAAGDTVTPVVPATGTVASKDIGTGKDVTIANITLSGADAGNYTLTQPAVPAVDITAKALTVTGVTASGWEYDGTTTTVTLRGGALQGVVDSEDVGFSLGDGTVADANAGNNKPVTTSITLTGADKGNYTLTQPTVTVNVAKRALTISAAAIDAKTYDGTTAATVNSVTLDGGLEGMVLNKDFMATGVFDDASAGGGKTVTITVTMGAAAEGNYTLPLDTYDLTGQTIEKAVATGVSQTFLVVTDYAKPDYSFDLSGLLPGLSIPARFGDITYTVTSVANDDGVLMAEPSVDTATSSLTLNVASVDEENKTAVITVTVSSDNYKDFTADFTIKTTDAIPVTISGITMTGGAYNGSAYTPSGTPVIEETASGNPVTDITLDYIYEGVDGTTFAPGTTAPVDAGKYKLTLSIPDGSMYTGSDSFTYEIIKATLTSASFTYEAPSSLTYDGSLKEAAVGFNLPGKTGCGTLVVTYVGTGSTSYNSETPPTDAGSYKVLAATTGATNYNDATGLQVGAFTIAPAPITGSIAIMEQNNVGTVGKIDVGDTLGVDLTALSPTGAASGLTYQWYLDGAAQTGETKATYVVPAGSTDKTITVKATAGGNHSGTLTSGPVEVDKITLSGSASISGGGNGGGGNGSQPSDGDISASNPQTGDFNCRPFFWLWLLIPAAVLAGVVVVVIVRRNRRSER